MPRAHKQEVWGTPANSLPAPAWQGEAREAAGNNSEAGAGRAEATQPHPHPTRGLMDRARAPPRPLLLADPTGGHPTQGPRRPAGASGQGGGPRAAGMGARAGRGQGPSTSSGPGDPSPGTETLRRAARGPRASWDAHLRPHLPLPAAEAEVARLAGWRQGLGCSGRGRREEAARTRQSRQMGPTRDQTGKQTGSTREGVWGQGAPTQPRRPGVPQPLAKESQANPEPRGTSVFPSVKWAHRLATTVGQALSPHRGQPAFSPSLQKATPVPGQHLGSSGADPSYSGPMALAPSLLLLGGGQGPPGPHDGQRKPRPVPHEPVSPIAGELRAPLQRPPTAQRAPLPFPSQVPTAGQPRGARLHAWAPLASGTHGWWPPGCGLAPVGGSPPQHPSLTPPSQAS